jgi:hypothetical protein
MTTELNFHTNAACLIISAAKESGLLEEIAQALHFADMTPSSMDCPACALRERLTEDFDGHVLLAYDVLECFYGEGFVLHEASEEEIVPYLYGPTERDDVKRAALRAAYGGAHIKPNPRKDER